MSLAPLHIAPAQPSPSDYYRDEDVRARIHEYCGGTLLRPATAAFVTGFDPRADDEHPTWDTARHVPPDELPALFARGCDISRSLWDTERLIVFLELDYQNLDAHAEPFMHPADVYLAIEGAYRAAASVFARLHLRARPLITGRGYHFVGQIPLGRAIIDTLAGLVPSTPSWHAGYRARRPAGVTAEITERHARAAAGLGLLLEHAAHLVLAEATRSSSLPVVLNGTVVGQGVRGRECVSIDISHMGDPLDVRHLRVAFGTYQWHRHRPDIFGHAVAAGVPPLVALPRGRQSLMTLLMAGRDLDAGRRAAHSARVFLPNVSRGVELLLASYVSSPLAAFHRDFHAARAAATTPPRRVDLDGLPPCVAASLQRPNDLLLKPEHLQHLIRGLMSRGWRAADIAGLVQSTYEQDHGWGGRWQRLDPRTRADFDVRVFAGLLATAADTLIDFNCVSAQEKGLCPRTGCRYDLRLDRDRLADVGQS